MKLSKKEIQDIYFKCLRLVKTKPPEFFNFRKMRGTVGLCYWTDIELDYRRDLIPTAFHELMHYLYPEWSESSILYAESRIMNICTPLEIAVFLKHLANKLYKAELFKETFDEPLRQEKQKKINKTNKSCD
jgi:hypothetical protein